MWCAAQFWQVDESRHFQKLAAFGTRLTNYKAVEHPSQPSTSLLVGSGDIKADLDASVGSDYIAQVAGSGLDVHHDRYITFRPEVRSVVDLLEAKNLTWKVPKTEPCLVLTRSLACLLGLTNTLQGYMENYPGNCFNDDTTGPNRYVRKHNPFIAFENIRNNARRCANIVNGDELRADVEQNRLPHFAYFTPGMDNDAHDTNITFAGEWLLSFLPPLLQHPNFFRDTLIVVTWDEDDYSAHNHVSTILLGSNVRAGHVDDRPYTHYSLLRTLEDNFELGTLGRSDARATPFDPSIYVQP